VSSSCACRVMFVVVALGRRSVHGEHEDDVAVPPLLETSAVWGLFLGVSSNLRCGPATAGLDRAAGCC
jgi:hypothetical protein